MRFLVDECPSTTLVSVANHAGHEAYHVVHLGMGGSKDHEIMPRIRAEEFTFVTNNAIDFRQLFKKEDLHAGLIILIPNVAPAVQRELFQAALDFLAER